MAASTRIYLGFTAFFGRASLVLGILVSFQNRVTLSLNDKGESFWKQNNTHIVVLNNASKYYLEKLFQLYGSNITGNIPEERFQNLLDALHIGEASKLARKEQTGQHRNNVEIDDKHLKCPSKKELLTEHGINTRKGVSQGKFVQLCPALVYFIESGSCAAENDNNHATLIREHTDGKKVWGYGFLSITVISLSSLMVIAIIPLIGRSVYNEMMSFLVALAVGTMAGDAILHLIPHALIPPTQTEDHNSNSHVDTILKSCVVVAGIYLLFIVESVIKSRNRGHTHAHSGSRTSHQHDENKQRSDAMTDERHTCKASKTCNTHLIGSRLAGVHNCNSCSDKTFGFSNLGDSSKLANGRIKTAKSCTTVACDSSITASSCSHNISDRSESVTPRKKQCYNDSELTLSGPKNTKSEYEFIYPIEYSHLECVKNNCDTNSTKCSSSSEVTETIFQLEKDVTLESKDSSGNSLPLDHKEDQGHYGNKVINVTTSIASVAWMVIVSDGFHNFSDGLAVGAAFSTSLATGLTTAIAVFCHEIPHELGDFAILIKSGMSIKQALAYNVVSAIISYIGLIFGILIGNIQSAHLWVLALTAGMFLYVSLVDMLPELKSYTSQGGIMIYLCQNGGMIIGILIMLTVALLE